MVDPIDPTATGFLLAENRNMPMHVGGLQLFEKPEGAGRGYVREMYEQMRDVEQVAPLFLKHPHRSLRTAGQLVWVPDEQFDIEVPDDLQPQQDITMTIRSADGATRQVTLLSRIDTPIEVDYYRHGGILPYVLAQLLAKDGEETMKEPA